MGKRIDRIVLTAATVVLLYLLFLSAFKNIVSSACLAVGCTMILLKKHPLHSKYRMSRLQAQLILEKWAYGPDDEAYAQISLLLSDREGEIIYQAKHPSASLSVNDVFAAWKQHRTCQKLILATPCRSESRARTFASTLKNPAVEIVDSDRLIPLIRRSDFPAPRALRGRQLVGRLRENLAALACRRPWHRNLLSGLVLMLMYLITGNAAYLLLSLALLFLLGAGIRIRKA